VFHLQLILRDWFVDQTHIGQGTVVPAPNFSYYLKAFERQNNIHWLPSVSNVPALLALRVAPDRVPTVPLPAAVPATAQASTVVRAALAAERQNMGPCVHNPGCDAHFTGNTAFDNNVRTRHVKDTISLAGGRETLLEIILNGESVGVCVSYHGKISCFKGCIGAAYHTPLTTMETPPFHERCIIAYE
jgi:hypothetical protein